MFMKFAIRTKIICVVSVLLLALAGSGLLAASNMRAMNANTSEIATNWLPSVKTLGELNAGIILYRTAIRAHLLAETVEEKQAVEKTLERIVENNTRIRKNYETMINSPDERALYDDWSKLWREYKDIAAKVIELSRKEAGQFPREAHRTEQACHQGRHRVRRHPEQGYRVQQRRRRKGNQASGGDLFVGADSPCGHCRNGHHPRCRLQLLCDTRHFDGHRFDRHTDAGAWRRPSRR